jgi:hypothetical protein
VLLHIESMSPFAGIGSFFCHWAAGRSGYVLFILFFEKSKKVGDERFFREVTLESAVNEEINDAVRPKQGQMLGYVGLAYIEGIFEVAHAFNALNKVFEDFDPNRMRNDFEEIDSFLDGNHIVFSFFFDIRTNKLSNLRSSRRSLADRSVCRS